MLADIILGQSLMSVPAAIVNTVDIAEFKVLFLNSKYPQTLQLIKKSIAFSKADELMRKSIITEFLTFIETNEDVSVLDPVQAILYLEQYGQA